MSIFCIKLSNSEPFVHKFDPESEVVMVFKNGKDELAYGNSMECIDNFACPASATMEFMIAEMDIEHVSDCTFDYLQLNFYGYSDSGYDSASDIYRLCGGTSSITNAESNSTLNTHVWYPSKNNQIVDLKFRSDASVNGEGFEIGFRCVPQDQSRPYPPTHGSTINDNDDTAFHVSIANAVAEGFKALGHFFNFLTSVTEND